MIVPVAFQISYKFVELNFK
ncbi:Protein of unknown function [Leuconostoc citreum LBAE C11]|nr:Protein of unknown function [Leuconostoc citreum LBAE C10]CCF25859.1 Protein of unknown function [Leuconostoc citreum LBAE C11]